ncbi:MFS transporter [Stutzerimonas azotifigens]|uniref:MFS transporter n=1 Tax=Stutzerimonas azotifigens TaxID=291995 RepID=UPI00041768D3|nr:MFS transporter [Stutzerimonas azotifigens]
MNGYLNGQIVRLFLAQALFWSCAMIGITLTSLVGLQLAPDRTLATLPLALTVLGHLLTLQPLARRMQRAGRRAGFQLGAGAGVVAGLLLAVAVAHADFALLCLGALLLGGYQASAMYYRFAALESVGDAFKGRATAWVIGGGVIAALATPSLGEAARNALPVPFAGAYLLVSLLALLGWLAVSGLRREQPPAAGAMASSGPRGLLRRPVVRAAMLTTAVGHGLMVLVMNATPLAMSFCGFDIETGAEVIQWHMLGMFLPAFIAGPLVDRLGGRRVAWLGAALIAASALVALSGLTQPHFLVSSLLLGMGWNLMLVAGTTLLGAGHAPEERSQAQSLMELGNGSMAAIMSFGSGALVTGLGWEAVNLGVLPVLALVVLVHLFPAGLRRGAPAQHS